MVWYNPIKTKIRGEQNENRKGWLCYDQGKRPGEAGNVFADLFDITFTSPGENPQLDIRNLMSPFIELISPLTPDGPVAKTLEKSGEGLALVSLKVANIEDAIAEMEFKGIRKIWHRGKRALFHPKDLYGVMIELAES